MGSRTLLTLAAVVLVGATTIRAEYRQIDLTIFGMD